MMINKRDDDIRKLSSHRGSGRHRVDAGVSLVDEQHCLVFVRLDYKVEHLLGRPKHAVVDSTGEAGIRRSKRLGRLRDRANNVIAGIAEQVIDVIHQSHTYHIDHAGEGGRSDLDVVRVQNVDSSIANDKDEGQSLRWNTGEIHQKLRRADVETKERDKLLELTGRGWR